MECRSVFCAATRARRESLCESAEAGSRGHGEARRAATARPLKGRNPNEKPSAEELMATLTEDPEELMAMFSV